MKREDFKGLSGLNDNGPSLMPLPTRSLSNNFHLTLGTFAYNFNPCYLGSRTLGHLQTLNNPYTPAKYDHFMSILIPPAHAPFTVYVHITNVYIPCLPVFGQLLQHLYYLYITLICSFYLTCIRLPTQGG